VTHALDDSSMATASRAFSDRVRSHPGVKDAVAHIESLMNR
jgi:hypothetical protein